MDTFGNDVEKNDHLFQMCGAHNSIFSKKFLHLEVACLCRHVNLNIYDMNFRYAK